MADCTQLQALLDQDTAELAVLEDPKYCENSYDPGPERENCIKTKGGTIATLKDAIITVSNHLQICNGFLGVWLWDTFVSDQWGFRHIVSQTLTITSYSSDDGLWAGTLTTSEIDGFFPPPPPQPEAIGSGSIDDTTLQVQFRSVNNFRYSGILSLNVSITGTITNEIDGTQLPWNAQR